MKLLDMFRAMRAARKSAKAPEPAAPAATAPAPVPPPAATAAPAPAAPATPSPSVAAPAPPPAAPEPASAGGIDGRWHCTMDTPMGEQAVMLSLSTAGGELSGEAESPFGSQSFSGGTITGHAIAWSISVTAPMAIDLDFRATVQGDVLDGVVVAGPFGENAFTGTRV